MNLNEEKCDKLVYQAIQGDGDAFAALVIEFKANLYRTALAMLGSEAAALDAVDESVYKAYLSIKKLRKPELFKTWITRILINVCKDNLKRRKRETGLEEVTETRANDNQNIELKLAIRSLPINLRQTIVLRYLSGYSLEETANILDKPVGTISTWQRRGLQTLRLELEDDYE